MKVHCTNRDPDHIDLQDCLLSIERAVHMLAHARARVIQQSAGGSP